MDFKKKWKREVIISSLLVLLAACAAVSFFAFIYLFNYKIIDDKIVNVKGKVEAVAGSSKPRGTYIIFDNDRAFLIPNGFSRMSKLTEYNRDSLEKKLIGKTVEIEYVDKLGEDYARYVTVDGETIDLRVCTEDYFNSVLFGMIFLTLLCLGMIAAFQYEYLKPRYKEYKKALNHEKHLLERQRRKQEMREKRLKNR